MAYSDFSLKKVITDFHLTLKDGSFLPEIEPIAPSPYFSQFFERNLKLAIALNTEKARSELLIMPTLVEVREILQEQISLFSGEAFDVDESLGLNGICDYILSRSPQQLLVEAPVVVLVEAKKEDLKTELGQCIAEMVAAQHFNQQRQQPSQYIYGVVTSGKLWQFLRLEGTTVLVDLTEYAVPPIEKILGILVWLLSQEVL